MVKHEITKAKRISNWQVSQWIVMYSGTTPPFVVYNNIIDYCFLYYPNAFSPTLGH